MTAALRDQTVAEIVARFPASARVFQAHRIDFCCKGDQTLAAAAGPAAERELLAEVEAAIRAPAAAAEGPATDLPTPALVGRILDRHHGYLRRALPAIGPVLEKVAAVHGGREPRLAPLLATFVELERAILPHLDEEEQVLFPLLLSRSPERGRVAEELRRMREDHLAVGAALERIRTLTGDFTAPEWSCRSYRLAMAELEDLETDLLRHVHLENHVLMPRFVARTPTGEETR